MRMYALTTINYQEVLGKINITTEVQNLENKNLNLKKIVNK